ncbi:MAG: PHB depolymerase family esterase [Mycobacteriales bacterium]
MLRGRVAAALCALLALIAVGAPAGALPGDSGAGVSTVVATTYDGALRQVRIYVPPKVPQRSRVPLVMVLHGLFLDPATAEATSGLDRVADDNDVAMVYPQGLNGSWNAGTCCDASSRNGVDDVGFLAHVVDLVDTLRPIDRDRVYIAGFSNGGMMALRAACARPDVFAAAASVGGTLQSGCLSPSPSSALLVHGMRDTTVQYEGSAYSRFLQTALTPVRAASLILARHAGCTTLRTHTSARYRMTTYRGCAPQSSVELVTVPGLGHHWPTATTDGVDGQKLVWSFLSRQRRVTA